MFYEKFIFVKKNLNADYRPGLKEESPVDANFNRLGAVIMVGGRGKRMGALTRATPKPLLKVGRHAILDYILGALTAVGVAPKNIVVVAQYLSEQIQAHLSNSGVSVVTGPRNGISLNLLAVLPDLPENFITASSDLYAPELFKAAVAAHLQSRAAATLVIARLGRHVPRRKYWRYTVAEGFLKNLERGRKLSGWERDLVVLKRSAIEKISASILAALQKGTPAHLRYKDFSDSWNLVLRLLLEAGLSIRALQRQSCRCCRINTPEDLDTAAAFAARMKLKPQIEVKAADGMK